VQAVQTPLVLQTPVTVLVEHAVPAAWNVRSVQTGAPLEHSVVAVASHGLVDVQVASCVHAVQTPALLQTPDPPLTVQADPTGIVEVVVQTGPDAVHVTADASAHWFVEVHVPPHRAKFQDVRIVPVPLFVQSMV
jgi:hypothetical protein